MLNFPSNPILNDTYSFGNKTWTFNGSAWDITSSIINEISTTSIIEGANLYFTNNRVVSALTAGQNISIASNGLITSNATGGGAVDSVNGLVGTVQLYTANIPESGNLYFTNARAISSLTAGQGIVLQSNGLIVSTATGTVTGVNGQTGNVSLTTSNVTEETNLYFTNARVSAAVSTQALVNATFSGNVLASVIRSAQSSGDEGGQFELANARTNQSLSGNIVIDVNQNRLRFFEISGTNRGAYIDIATAASGVGTNLLSGPTAGGIKSATIVDPTASENFTMFFTPNPLTLVRAQAVVVGINPNVVVSVSSGINRTTPTTNNILAFSVSNTTTGNNVTIANTTIVANSWVWLSTSAVSGTANTVSVSLQF